MALILFLLSNLYVEVRRWSYVSKVKEVMKERELEKDFGCTSVESGVWSLEHDYELLMQGVSLPFHAQK